MTEREKIISFASKSGLRTYDDRTWAAFYTSELERFYHAVQADAFEQAANVCESLLLINESDHSEGETYNWAITECADAIRQLGKEKK